MVSGVVRPVLPLPGPLDQDPLEAVAAIAAEHAQLVVSTACTMLACALVDVECGAWDERVVEQLAELDASVIATVASLLRRCWQAGAAAGRAEVQAELAEAEATVTRLADERDGLQAARLELRTVCRDREARIRELEQDRDATAQALARVAGQYAARPAGQVDVAGLVDALRAVIRGGAR